MSLQDGLDKLSNGANQLLGSPLATSLGGALVGGALVGTAVAVARSGKKKTRKSTRKKSSKRKTSRKRRSKRKGRRTPHTAGKGKDRSRKRIRYTKNGQPYVIQANGRARFIKKTGARRSHRTKGGRY